MLIGVREPGRTWYDVAHELQLAGYTYLQIAMHFKGCYGFKISQYAVRDWMLAWRANELLDEQTASASVPEAV